MYKTSENSEKRPSRYVMTSSDVQSIARSPKYSICCDARPRKVANFHIWEPRIVKFGEFLLEKQAKRLVDYQNLLKASFIQQLTRWNERCLNIDASVFINEEEGVDVKWRISVLDS